MLTFVYRIRVKLLILSVITCTLEYHLKNSSSSKFIRLIIKLHNFYGQEICWEKCLKINSHRVRSGILYQTCHISEWLKSFFSILHDPIRAILSSGKAYIIFSLLADSYQTGQKYFNIYCRRMHLTQSGRTKNAFS